MQIAGADLVAFEQQIVELDRLLQRRGRRVGKPRALFAGRAIKQIDDDAVRQIRGRAPDRSFSISLLIGSTTSAPKNCGRIQIAVPIPLRFFVRTSGLSRANMPVLGKDIIAASCQLRPTCSQILRELPDSGKITR